MNAISNNWISAIARPSAASLLALSVLCAGGCAKKKDKEEAKQEEAPAAATSQSPAEKRAQEQKVVEALAASVQTQEDFEEQAETDITDQNVEAELAKLEAEIKADPEGAPPAASASEAPAASAKP